MIYRFDDFELDVDKAELRSGEGSLPIEPQVFALLLLLIENRDRLVSKDEIIEKVWDGRFISDSALTSRIKSARRLIGDDGRAQNLIRTIRGKGFRFVGEARERQSVRVTGADAPPAIGPAGETQRPSIAVLPFRLVGVAGPYAGVADALPHDLIVELSRLRWLFVIARGSSFRFRGDTDLNQIGAMLGARYCLAGAVEVVGRQLTITVELSDTRDGGVVWGDRIASNVDDIYEVREQIVANIVTALELQIPLQEARRARLTSPENLDAWGAYHLGLQHMFRFNKSDNALATQMFERAVAQDPGFARAHAGLSFTHFQNAFVRYTNDPAAERELARRYAEESVALDSMDPFANFTMGRAHWLGGDLDASLSWLDRSISLSPNYAQGIYAKAWAETISGHGQAGMENVDLAMSLSPLDPFRYAMLGTRAFSHIVRGEDQEAASWAEKAARAPNAHLLIAMIAVAAHELAGNRQKAEAWAVNVWSRSPIVTQGDFFNSFPFDRGATKKRISVALAQFGF